jgi:DNA-binding transcriptional MerR regulator
VLARLTPEFSELTPSKLRFLEEQKLICPARTDAGYRKFSPDDVERVRCILSLQRDHYLPLKVIRSYLADRDAGKNPAFPGGRGSILNTGRRFSRPEVIREAGAMPALLNDAISASVVVGADSYGEETVKVLRALVELQRSGIEPRHLRGFRAAVERELGLIESALVPLSRRKDLTSKARVIERAREIAGHLEVIRGNLIRSALGRIDP